MSEYENADGLRNSYLYFPLRESWRRFREKDLLGPDFADFQAFYDWAVRNGYVPGASIRRKKQDGLAYPDNCYILAPDPYGAKAKNKKPPKIKGGYRNSPCISCVRENKDYCSSYKCCWEYIQWISESWKAFNRYARREAGRKKE